MTYQVSRDQISCVSINLSVHAKLVTGHPQLCRRDEPLVRHRHAIQFAVEIARPEIEEMLEPREARMDIVLLPDVGL